MTAAVEHEVEGAVDGGHEALDGRDEDGSRHEALADGKDETGAEGGDNSDVKKFCFITLVSYLL